MRLLPGILLLVVLAVAPSWSAITVDTTASGDSSNSSTSITTKSFSTASGNELLLAFISTDAVSSGVSVSSVTGGGLTWVLVKRTNAQLGTAEIWRSFAASPLTSVTVTAKLSQSVAASITVVAFTGVDSTGTNGSGAIGATASASGGSGAPNGSLVTTRAGSWIFGVGNDWDNAIGRTPGSGQTVVHQFLASVGDTYWVQRQNNITSGSGTTVTINDTVPTGDRYNLTLCEVLAPSGVSSTFTVSGSITPAASGQGTTLTLSSNGTTVATATADSAGNYSLQNIANGSYTLTPTKSGFTFNPVNQPITVNGADVTASGFTATQNTFTVSGSITPAASGQGTTLTLSSNGTTVATATEDSTGSYSLPGIANGNYTLTPTKTGFTFSPVNQPITVNGANVTASVFTATQVTFTVSGTVTPAASGQGTILTLSSNGTTVATATADNTGSYSLSGIANGSYTLTPTKSGFTFSPANQPITINGANVTASSFTATALTFSISGIITGAGGSTVTLSQNGTTITSATADASGNYSFGNVANGTYTVTPSQSGFTFSPANQPATVNGGNVTGINFTATATGIKLVQGNVNGNEASGSSIAVSFASPNTPGNFLIVTGTAARPSTTLTISDTLGNSYLPAFGPVTDPNQNVTAYIWYVPSCKGGANAITLTPATSAALEIHVSEWTGLATTSPVDQTASATGTGTAASSGQLTTTANGELIFGYTFLFNTATAGTGFTGITLVNGDLDEYQVQSNAGPIAATFTQTSGTWFALLATFKPANSGPPPPAWSIKGAITPTGSGAGSTVTLSGASTATVTADTSGNYVFSGLSNANYTVTPNKPGYSFIPPSQSVTVSGADVTAVNFTAQANGTGILGIDAQISGDSSSVTNAVQTPSFSTAAGSELLLAFIATDYVGGANTTVTGVSGAGLTWTLVLRTNAQRGTAEIWRAFSTSALSSVTVTATLSQSVAASVTVMSFTGVDTTGTNGSGAIGATSSTNASSGGPSATLQTTRNNSWVLGVGNDYDNAIARTVGTGQTLVHQNLSFVNDTYWVQRQNNVTPASGTSVTINDTAPTSDRYNLSIVEVLAAATGGGSPPSVSMTAPAPNATVSGNTTVSANATDQVAVSSVQFLLDSNNLGSPVTAAPYAITWDTTTATAGNHSLAAVARNSAGLITTSTPITVTVDNSGNLAVVGSWSSPVSIPTVAVNLILTYNNKLLFYEDGSSPTIWDYLNNTFTNISTSANLFCSGHTVLSDGRILAAGGFGGDSTHMGIPDAEIFNPANNTWTSVPSMSFRRWYPTATTLSDGRVLVTAGWQTTNHTNAGIPEIYDPATNKWTQLTGANNPFETYPFIYVLPDGRILHVGNTEVPSVTDALDLNSQTWTVIDPNIVDGGSATMYLPGHMVKAGSATDSQGSGPSSNTTFVLDMTQTSPAWKQTASMAFPRSFLNLVTLADGNVLAVGGETDKNGGIIGNAVFAAELWSPQTQTWSTMASMHTPREYHSTALLVPDGRVVVSGMGADFGNVPDEMTAEFYSPPYLFKGARPTITQSPAQIHYGQAFSVSTPDGASIAKATLIRTGAVTHFFDQNTRYVPLTFSQTTGGLSLTAPPDGNTAPPGYYMLFLVNSNGVPSVAPIVQLLP